MEQQEGEEPDAKTCFEPLTNRPWKPIELSDCLHADAESLESDPQKLQELNDTSSNFYRLPVKTVRGVEALRQIRIQSRKTAGKFFFARRYHRV